MLKIMKSLNIRQHVAGPLLRYTDSFAYYAVTELLFCHERPNSVENFRCYQVVEDGAFSQDIYVGHLLLSDVHVKVLLLTNKFVLEGLASPYNVYDLYDA